MKWTDEKGEHTWRDDKYVEYAYFEALYYGDKTKLLRAIEHGLPELLQPEYREMLAVLVDKGGVKKRGFKPEKNRSDSERNSKLWAQVHWYEGKGYPVYSLDHPCACSLAGKALGLSLDQAYRIYRHMGGKSPKSEARRMAAKFYRVSAAYESDESNPLIKQKVGIK